MEISEVIKEWVVAIVLLIITPFLLLTLLVAYIMQPIVMLFDKGDAEDEDEAVL